MREIKFRGKDRRIGKWYYGNLYVDEIHGRTYIRTHKPGCLDVDPETVGQFTGLMDKNGAEIYEGDIVQCGTFRYEVIYEGSRFASFALKRKEDTFLHYFGEAMESAECEVISNIHDNTIHN